jgi:glucose-6-phosphate isomerase
VQQLRDGRNDFFATFVNVMRDREGRSMPVEPDVTAGDYLASFLLGTRDALHANGRESITVTLDQLNAHRLGALIALFERAVGLYAELIDVNAYDQPGVEAGKEAAAGILELQRRVLAYLRLHRGEAQTAEELALALHASPETIFHILEHAAANPDHGVTRQDGATATAARYQTT